MIIAKTIVVIFIILWCWLGYWIFSNFRKIFGKHKDDPSESAGARSYVIVQISSIWILMLAAFIYLLTF